MENIDASREFPDMCLAAFRGKEEKEYTPEQLGARWSDIYEFCAKYVDRRKALKNDQDAIEKAHAFFKSERGKLKQQNNVQKAAQPTETSKPDDGKEGSEEKPTTTAPKQESAVYTEAFGFIHELRLIILLSPRW